MSECLTGERTLMRIFIAESDRWHHKPLHEALVDLFRSEGFAGATVLKGVSGFGATSVLHTDHLLSLSNNLPLVIEVVDSEEKFTAILPKLDEMLPGGLVTLEKIRVLRYCK